VRIQKDGQAKPHHDQETLGDLGNTKGVQGGNKQSTTKDVEPRKFESGKKKKEVTGDRSRRKNKNLDVAYETNCTWRGDQSRAGEAFGREKEKWGL